MIHYDIELMNKNYEIIKNYLYENIDSIIEIVRNNVRYEDSFYFYIRSKDKKIPIFLFNYYSFKKDYWMDYIFIWKEQLDKYFISFLDKDYQDFIIALQRNYKIKYSIKELNEILKNHYECGKCNDHEIINHINKKVKINNEIDEIIKKHIFKIFEIYSKVLKIYLRKFDFKIEYIEIKDNYLKDKDFDLLDNLLNLGF